MRRHLIIIARDRPDVWLNWATFYGGAESVHLILDRRHAPPQTRPASHADRRTQPNRTTALYERGFFIIPEHETANS